jgi:hypothetical protein
MMREYLDEHFQGIVKAIAAPVMASAILISQADPAIAYPSVPLTSSEVTPITRGVYPTLTLRPEQQVQTQ